MQSNNKTKVLAFFGLLAYMTVEAFTVSDVFLTAFGYNQGDTWAAMLRYWHIPAAVVSFSYMALLLAVVGREDSGGFKGVVTGLIGLLNMCHGLMHSGDWPMGLGARFVFVFFPMVFGVMMASIYYLSSEWYMSANTARIEEDTLRIAADQARTEADEARTAADQARELLFEQWATLKPDTLRRYNTRAKAQGDERFQAAYEQFKKLQNEPT